jgi:ubiquinone/menaquinone biosynthesis C-methylase UbiE
LPGVAIPVSSSSADRVVSSPWYEAFFGRDYLDVFENAFDSERVAREADFVYRALGLRAGEELLDLCCGPGRHAVELAKRGLRVTGLDLSSEYLATAERVAREQGTRLAGTVHSDMRAIPFESHFDVVINMFSSFGYLESEPEDAKVLTAIARALKPGGRALLDLLNHEWVILNYQTHDWHTGTDGTIYLEHRRLDLPTSRNHVTFTSVAPDGARRDIVGHHFRLYTLREMIGMLSDAGLRFESAYGDFDARPYGIDTWRMLIVASKPA